MRILILDDISVRHDTFDRIYNDPSNEVVHVYRYTTFLDYLSMFRWDLIHLDHDLGDFVENPDTYVDGWGKTREYNGGHAAMRICELTDDLLPARIIIHSVNPTGARAMKSMLERRGVPVTWEPFSEPSEE